ncbi:MAG: poly-gamma-glutamate biosynthesis protein PgsC [Corallococcus sp.]|nr:poly-gamma-glutamate biosynthesis protein PgsC [Corallococcus sp.]
MAEILILGVLISIVFYELTDLSPGGIIVPGLMVMYIANPLRMLYTLVVAIVAYYVVKLFSMRFLVFGKRRFVLLILVSFVLHVLLNLILGLFTHDFSNTVISLVGYTVAGIIANNMYRQGVVKTSLSLGIVIGILELVIVVLRAAGVVI